MLLRHALTFVRPDLGLNELLLARAGQGQWGGGGMHDGGFTRWGGLVASQLLCLNTAAVR